MGYMSREDFDFSDIDIRKDILIIDEPMGRGKSYWAVNHAAQDFRAMGVDINTVLIVHSRAAKVDEQVREYPHVIKADDTCFLESTGAACTYAICIQTLSQIIADGNFRAVPQLIIFDEIHTQIEESTWNGTAAAWHYLLGAMDRAVVVGLSATPTLLFDYVRQMGGRKFVRLTPHTTVRHKAEHINCYMGTSVQTYMRTVDAEPHNKMLIYTNSAQSCYKLAQQYPCAGFLISRHNKDIADGTTTPLNELMDSQIVDSPRGRVSLRDYVSTYQKLPPSINMLFITSAYREGVNIKDSEVRHVVVDACDMITIEQVFGRVRHDIDTFSVVVNYSTRPRIKLNISNTAQFLNLYKQIDGEDNQQLFLMLRYQQQQLYKQMVAEYKKQQALIKMGYQVVDKMSKPDEMSDAVYLYEGRYYINPFVRPVLEYYEEQFLQIESGFGGDTYKIDGRLLEDCKGYFRKLNRYSRSDVEFCHAYDLREQVQQLENQQVLESLNLEKLFDMRQGESRFFTSDEFRKVCESVSLSRGDYKPAGVTTVKKYLAQLCKIEQVRRTVCGVRQRGYLVTLHRTKTA